MYLLEMVVDCGYEGTFTSSKVCSEDKEKLDVLATSLKHNLIHIFERMTIFRNYLDEKYSSIRIQSRRTDDEIIELDSFQEDLISQYPDISKYNLFDYWYSISDIEFIVKEINFI